MAPLNQPASSPTPGPIPRRFYSREFATAVVINFVKKYPDAVKWYMDQYNFTLDHLVYVFRSAQPRWNVFKQGVKLIHRVMFLKGPPGCRHGEILPGHSKRLHEQLHYFRQHGFPRWIERVSPSKSPYEGYDNRLN